MHSNLNYSIEFTYKFKLVGLNHFTIAFSFVKRLVWYGAYFKKYFKLKNIDNAIDF